MTLSNLPVYPRGAFINTWLQPGVETARDTQNPFSGFLRWCKTVETVADHAGCGDTRLKPGVNEKFFTGDKK